MVVAGYSLIGQPSAGSGPPCPAGNIVAFEERTGLTLPGDLVGLLLQANGLAPRGIFIHGDEGTLQIDFRRITLIPEPKESQAQEYGSINFPKAARDEYLAKFANETRQQRPEPKEIPVERGQTHNWYFIDSILNNKPSRENATEGHYAAAAAHLCNLAYRHKTRASWDPATGKVKL